MSSPSPIEKGDVKPEEVPQELRRILKSVNKFSESVRKSETATGRKIPYEAETLIVVAGRKNDDGNGGKRHDFLLELDGNPEDLIEGLSRLVKRLKWNDFENLITTMLGNLQPYAFASILMTIQYGDELRAQREASQPQMTGTVN